jgi:hypothetical protein
MRRAFVLPVSAAVIGALLAVGVAALDGAFDRFHHRVQVVHVADHVDAGELEIDLSEVERQIADAMEMVEQVEIDTEIRFEKEILRDVREQLRGDLDFAVEARELSEAEEERLREALEQIEEQLPMAMGLSGIAEGITREDGAAHKRAPRN